MKYVPHCGMIIVNFTTRGYKSMNQEKTKLNTFSEREIYLDFLSNIDGLPNDVSNKLQAVILKNGCHASYFDERRTKEIDILIENNYLVDVSEPRKILDKMYSRDNLFMELSKRQYGISPKSNTTKQNMIDWILENSEKLTEKLTQKYATLCYAEKVKQHIDRLYDLLRKLDDKHTYRAEKIYLTEFYYEIENEEKVDTKNLDTIINNLSVQNKKQTANKKKNIALILCLFGGYFGLHHFYVGKIGMGILYLCTVGLFCIGWIVDVAKLITGEFKDKYGNYLK